MRQVMIYTAARIALFLATFGILWLLGAKSWLGALLALLISGIVSYVVLSRQRDAVSSSVNEKAKRMSERIAEGAAREDD
jgi:TctA family transporter